MRFIATKTRDWIALLPALTPTLSLRAPQDRQVSELAQELASKLGLKGRKAYISSQGDSPPPGGEGHGEGAPPTGEVGTVTVKVIRVGSGDWLLNVMGFPHAYLCCFPTRRPLMALSL